MKEKIKDAIKTLSVTLLSIGTIVIIGLLGLYFLVHRYHSQAEVSNLTNNVIDSEKSRDFPYVGEFHDGLAITQKEENGLYVYSDEERVLTIDYQFKTQQIVS